MNKKLLTAALISLTLSTTTLANGVATQSPHWSFVEVSYNSVDIDDIDSFSPDGWEARVSSTIGKNIIITAAYSQVSDKITDLGTDVEIDFDQFSAGLGYRYGITDTTDIYGLVSYEGISIDATTNVEGEDTSDSGYGLIVGVRSMIIKQVELAASIGTISIDGDSETTYDGNIFYHFNSHFSIGAGFNSTGDLNTYSGSLRVAF